MAIQYYILKHVAIHGDISHGDSMFIYEFNGDSRESNFRRMAIQK